jgi:inositol phosphorylceramide mannosyltransferase catalytic subunit
MRHYGGIYIDLDNGCLESLEPLLYYPCWTTDGGQGALSNNILAARPGHPFWVMMTEKLVDWGWNYGLPYVTISWASGQWFLTQMWERYHAKIGLSTGRTVLEISGVGAAAASKAAKELDPYDPDRALYRVMMDMREGAARWVFFDMGRGETWRNWDNYVFMWIGGHLLRVILGGVLLAAALLGACWACVRWRTGRYRRKGETRGNGYAPVREDDVELLHSSDRDA